VTARSACFLACAHNLERLCYLVEAHNPESPQPGKVVLLVEAHNPESPQPGKVVLLSRSAQPGKVITRKGYGTGLKEMIEMAEIQIKLSAIWIALMLTYLLGDVLRIFSGDFKGGEIGGMQVSQNMYLGMAMLMVIPILMVFLSLTLPDGVNRWANIIIAIIFFVFNLVGLPTYPSAYDKFLIIVGLGFNVLTVWYAWKWV